MTDNFNRRVGKFRHDLQEMKVRFEAVKKQQDTLKNDQNRDSLLRRPNRGGPNVVRILERREIR
jgi:Golgi SNAP receptor complex protein 2